jgi:hypothetical protein
LFSSVPINCANSFPSTSINLAEAEAEHADGELVSTKKATAAKKGPVKKAPAKKTPVKKTPAKKTLIKNASARKAGATKKKTGADAEDSHAAGSQCDDEHGLLLSLFLSLCRAHQCTAHIHRQCKHATHTDFHIAIVTPIALKDQDHNCLAVTRTPHHR